jgi:hypothetical protein
MIHLCRFQYNLVVALECQDCRLDLRFTNLLRPSMLTFLSMFVAAKQ